MGNKQYHKFFLFAVLGIALVVTLYLGLTQKPSVPDLTLTDLAGKPVALAQFQGKTVLVNFWATSCPGCVKEMPQLAETYAHYHDKGFELVAVAMSYDTPDHVRQFAAERGLPFPVVLDSQGDIAHAFGDVKLTPTSFLIDGDGHIVEQTIGDLDFAKLRQRLDGIGKSS
ncbi:MAG: TlpA disulfide reductase family protein [Sulfuriferula sp.]|nr:TlpA disulfide reductase family protein [Sulfuriferula sp.]